MGRARLADEADRGRGVRHDVHEPAGDLRPSLSTTARKASASSVTRASPLPGPSAVSGVLPSPNTSSAVVLVGQVVGLDRPSLPAGTASASTPRVCSLTRGGRRV